MQRERETQCVVPHKLSHVQVNFGKRKDYWWEKDISFASASKYCTFCSSSSDESPVKRRANIMKNTIMAE